MSDAYCPNWKYNNVIVGYLMKIHAAVETVNLLSLPIDIEEKLKKESILKTVHYSTKIEGNTLNLDEVHHAIENGIGKWADRKDVREVRNYYDALLFLEKKASRDAPVTQEFIRELHAIIDAKTPGKMKKRTPYRDGQNVIRDSGSGGIVYLPPEAKDVPALMEKLAEWIENKENSHIPIPITAAVASYQLVTIHPFWDGNGRTARALATYILKRGNYDLKGFYSMEEFYDKDIQRYYDSLQMGLHHNYYFGRNNADLTPWITYFLEVMADIFERVNKKVNSLYYETSDRPKLFDVLDKRERWVANFILRKGAIRVVDMTDHFKIDKKTAMNWLKAWEEKGFVKRKSLAKKRYIEFILEENIRNNLMPVGK
jgi:Fic family protein